MSRPTKDDISNVNNWDGPVDGNFAKVFSTPFPPAEYADYASLPTATSYDGCVAWLADEKLLVLSVDGVWERVGLRADYQADSTAATVSDLKDDLNSLLAKLKASSLMASS